MTDQSKTLDQMTLPGMKGCTCSPELESGTMRSIETARYRDTVDSESGADRHDKPGPTNGYWRDVDWLGCRDGKWRPTESRNKQMDAGLADRMGYSRIGDRYSLSTLIKKAENRVIRLRGYGNAVNAK